MPVGSELVKVVAHSFRIRGDKASKGMWAAEMKAAKELMTKDPKVPADVMRTYTTEQIIGCLDTLARQGVTVTTLRLFVKAPRLLENYIREPSKYQAPEWLAGKKTHGLPPPNF